MHVEADQPRPDAAAAPAPAPNGARGCFALGDRRRRRRRRLHRRRRRLRLRQPGRQDERQPDLDARRQRLEAARAAGHPVRRRPQQLAHRLRRLRRLQRRDAARSRATSSRRPTAARRGRTSAARSPARTRPVNSIILDPSYPNTLYAGTDVGAFVTYNGGAHVDAARHGLPDVAIWQLDLNPSAAQRVLVAGTHGRGALRPERRVAGRSGVRPLEGRRRQAGRAGQQRHLHPDAPQHRQRRCDRRHHHRPDPGEHHVRRRLGRNGGTLVERRGQVDGPDGAEGVRRRPRRRSRSASRSASRRRCARR